MTPRGRARRRRRGIGGEGGKKRRRSRGVVRRGRGRCRLVFIARPGVNKGAEAYYRRECSYIALPVFHPGHLPCTTRLILPLPPPPSPSPAPSTTAPPTASPRVSAEGPRRRTRPARGKAGGGQPERTRPAGRGPSPEHARAVRLCLLSSLRRWARLCWLAPWPWPYGSNRIRNNFISISFSPRFLQCPLFFLLEKCEWPALRFDVAISGSDENESGPSSTPTPRTPTPLSLWTTARGSDEAPLCTATPPSPLTRQPHDTTPSKTLAFTSTPWVPARTHARTPSGHCFEN